MEMCSIETWLLEGHTMNRRTLLKLSAASMAALALPTAGCTLAQATAEGGDLAELTITVRDDGYDIPDGLTAGRYAVSVVNAGTTPSHASLGRLPDGVTEEQVMTDMSSQTQELPDWFLNAGYVGLPDWAPPGETRSGVVDLSAGNFFMFDPFSSRNAFVTVAEGEAMGAEPDSAATVEMTEMHFMLPEGGLPTGAARLKISNIGAIPHEFQVLAVPEGTTADQIAALFAMPEDATPAPGDELAQALVDYAPVAATSILGAGLTSWIDTDLAPGTYAVICALPFPDGVPHAMQGMLEIVTLA
jgi:hypothetical protein